MAGYYPYLISSLPGLTFGSRPPLTFERLFTLCAGLLSREDEGLLRLTASPEAILEYSGGNRTLHVWRGFETSLRNELVRIRAGRLKRDPGLFVRPLAGGDDPAMAHAVLHAHRNPSLLESERMLDLLRWRALDELSLGHYFDLDALLVYGLRLGVLLRWELINAADKAALLAEAVPLP